MHFTSIPLAKYVFLKGKMLAKYTYSDVATWCGVSSHLV